MARARNARRSPETLHITHPPAPAPEKLHGWCERTARNDGGAWFGLAITTISFDEDPLVEIKIDRRYATLFGERNRDCCDYIEDWRASDLDALVVALQQTIAVARHYGMIAPATDLTPGRQAYAKMQAADARTKAIAERAKAKA